MIDDAFQGSFFDDCSSKCEAYSSCGGFRATAPCGCIWRSSSGRRYKCETCYIICRERRAQNEFAETQNQFSREINSGLNINSISVKQISYDLPSFIPYNTQEYKGSYFFKNFVAVDIKSLFNCRKSKPASIKSRFTSEAEIRKYFQASTDSTLIAILNGKDWRLESIWAMPRRVMLKQLHSLGFSICTGPTFSITALTTENTPVPYSHHTAMLMRHHRLLSEIDQAGLCAIPNLYWLDGDKRQIKEWASWLTKNPKIGMLSKDFTSTRKWESVEPKVKELIILLAQVLRPFHIFIIGTGQANAIKVKTLLTQAGHTVSIVTSAPIIKAMRGSKYFFNALGILSDTPSSKQEHSFTSLIEHNIEMFTKSLAV